MENVGKHHDFLMWCIVLTCVPRKHFWSNLWHFGWLSITNNRMGAESFRRGAFKGGSKVWDWSMGSLRVALYGRFHSRAARTREAFFCECKINRHGKSFTFMKSQNSKLVSDLTWGFCEHDNEIDVTLHNHLPEMANSVWQRVLGGHVKPEI